MTVKTKQERRTWVKADSIYHYQYPDGTQSRVRIRGIHRFQTVVTVPGSDSVDVIMEWVRFVDVQATSEPEMLPWEEFEHRVDRALTAGDDA